MQRFLYTIFSFLFTLCLSAQALHEWDLLITDVQLFTGKKVIKKTDLGVKGGIITHLGPELARQGTGREQIDGKNHTLVPGLVNTHVHAWFPLHLQQAAQAGVLAVCDMHGTTFAMQFLGQFRDSSNYARYYAAGSGATVPGGHGTQFGMIVPTIDSTNSARQFTLDRIAEGVDYIKILREPMRPTVSYEQIDTIIRTAHAAGVKVIAHVSRCEDGVELTRLGVDGLAHIWFDRAMTEAELEVFAARKKLFIVPTTLTNMRLLSSLDGKEDTEQRQTLDSVGLLNEIRRLYEAGVQILAGTDPPNFGINYGTDLHVELQLLEAAGIPARECLAGATVKSAESFGLPGPLTLQVGGVADFLLVKGDALQSVAALEDLVGVWKGGVRVATE